MRGWGSQIRIVCGVAGALAGGVVLCWSPPALAATITVGPGKDHATVSAAIAAASPGDVIEIDPGTYTDDFSVITTGDLTIRGVGSTRPHLQATQLLPNKKGIFVIETGTGPITVENIEFSGAEISAGDGDNGAGIRMQGSELTVRDCYFHDNQNGILSGGTADYTVTIEGSEFADNGNAGSGQEHNVYISGDCARFEFVGNHSHDVKSGHTLKTRAKENWILYNRLMDEDGAGSYQIDVPNGGETYIIGNLIQQGLNAENHGTMVNYKGEGNSNPNLDLYFVHNTVVNAKNASPAMLRVHVADDVVAYNNLFVGMGTPIVLEDGNIPLTEMGTMHEASDPGLVDMASYDYHLLETSGAVDMGVAVPTGMMLEPDSQYLHPRMLENRAVVNGTPDVGAYEWGVPVGDGDGDGDGNGDGDGDGDGGDGDGDGDGDGGSGDGGSGDGGSGDGGGDGDGDGDGDETGAGASGEDDDGCACAATPEHRWPAGALSIFGLLGLGLVSRRMRRRAPIGSTPS